MLANMNLHFITKLHVGELQGSGSSRWRRIEFTDKDGATFEVAAFPKGEDMTIEFEWEKMPDHISDGPETPEDVMPDLEDEEDRSDDVRQQVIDDRAVSKILGKEIADGLVNAIHEIFGPVYGGRK